MKLVLSYSDNLAGTAFWCIARMTLFIWHLRLFCYKWKQLCRLVRSQSTRRTCTVTAR